MRVVAGIARVCYLSLVGAGLFFVIKNETTGTGSPMGAAIGGGLLAGGVAGFWLVELTLYFRRNGHGAKCCGTKSRDLLSDAKP